MRSGSCCIKQQLLGYYAHRAVCVCVMIKCGGNGCSGRNCNKSGLDTLQVQNAVTRLACKLISHK